MNLAAELASRGALLIFGLLLWMSTTLSLMRTVIVPRPLKSTFTDVIYGTIIGVARVIARFRRDYSGRDAVLAWVGPMLILGSLIAWLIGYLVSYAFLLYGTGNADFGEAFRQSGSSLLTLGFSSSRSQDQTIIDFIAAATGPIVIGMMIGFLPTIYSAYLDREAPVTLLSSLAGEPAWGVELLSRSALTETLNELPELFAQWREWAAAQRMALTTYPVLAYVRSPRRYRHFTTSMLAVLDAAALCASLNPGLVGRSASRLLIQGSQTFDVVYVNSFTRRPKRTRVPFIGRFFGASAAADPKHLLVPNVNPGILAVHAAAAQDAVQGMDRRDVGQLDMGERGGSTLPRAEFDDAVDRLRRSGFPITADLDDAWGLFRTIRSSYEFPAYQIMRALDVAPAPWSGPRRKPTPVVYPTVALEQLPPASGSAPDAHREER